MISIQDRKAFSGKRASEGLTSNFKSSSRDKKASWGNRFIRDHNDLVYNADPHSISNRLKQSAKTPKEATPTLAEASPINKF
jgi:hypothetical protein